MRRFTLSLLIVVLFIPFAFAAQSQAADEAKPTTHEEREAYAKDFALALVTILHDHKKSYGDRKDILRRAFADSVDIDWMAKFVLGRAWRDATDAQREQYTALYRKFLTESYITNFAENPDKSIYDIKVLGVNDDEANAFTVRTRTLLMNQINLNVEYRVSEHDTHYRVQDIIIENVSLIATHRAEFTKIASAGGVDGVIRKLEELTRNTSEITLSMK